ncbi:hypothetical protein FGO68_gene8140 [Halteria grandinella]|uniref:PPM-type phosphatase domain-containing protein n=1 Tax=Halteria grandinella TaxID=5974 RepID=A0A8J8SVK7_HALGN|nr:hypothetical protein FGO68_gene8140 [Halteria grandinella]
MLRAIVLTQEHKPTEPKEGKRIKKCNGDLRYGDGRGGRVLRVYRKHEDQPGLHLTRTLGDEQGHIVGVKSEPDVTLVKMDRESYMYVIITGNQALWSQINAKAVQEICKIEVRKYMMHEEQVGGVAQTAVDTIADTTAEKAQISGMNLAQMICERFIAYEKMTASETTVFPLATECSVKIVNEELMVQVLTLL